jgi:hypothetical protein
MEYDFNLLCYGLSKIPKNYNYFKSPLKAFKNNFLKIYILRYFLYVL